MRKGLPKVSGTADGLGRAPKDLVIERQNRGSNTAILVFWDEG